MKFAHAGRPRRPAKLIFTAHSVPMTMAETSDYQKQLQGIVPAGGGALGSNDWRLVYQSRSGPPSQPWLEPDIADALRELDRGADVAVVPIGFVSDHIEVIYDLDRSAGHRPRARREHGASPTVGVHPKFLQMIRELIEERLGLRQPRAIGQYPRVACLPADCCPAPARRPAPRPGYRWLSF
jgi:ferrochelatase